MQHLYLLTLVLFLAVLYFPGPCPVKPQATTNRKLCNGVFDLYFVLDSSYSVGNNYQTNIVPFVENITIHYAESGFRIAIVTFDRESRVYLNLTSIANRTAVMAALNRLRNVKLGRATILSPALEYVNREISDGSDKGSKSIILIVTDGELSQIDVHRARGQAQLAQHRGSTIFAIAVGNLRQQREQLSALTGSEDQVFHVTNFNYLNAILDQVVEDICIEITVPNTAIHNIVPLKYCKGQIPNITISGSGFITLIRPICHFWTPVGLNYSIQPLTEDRTISCRSPNTGNYTGELYLQLTTRNNYKANRTTLVISECMPPVSVIITEGFHTAAITLVSCLSVPQNYAFIAGIVGGLLALLALLLCCLLWCLFPLITGTIVGGVAAKQDEEPVLVPSPPPTPSAPPPPPPVATPLLPGRKWSIVDTSYYGMRGAGGIRPMKVKWGNKGTTEEGAKLRRAENAVKLGEVEVQGPPAPPTSPSSTLSTIIEENSDRDEPLINSKGKPGCCKLYCLLCYQWCCGMLIQKIKRCYTVIASYRPVFTYHGTLGKRILCCPGPNIEEKLCSTGPTSRADASQPPHRKLLRTNKGGIQMQQPLLSPNLSKL